MVTGGVGACAFIFIAHSAMAEGRQEGWEVAPGYRRRGGPLHDEVAQGRGGEELETPHSRGSQEQQPRGTGRGAAILIKKLHVDECGNEVADRVARYQFD